MLTRLLLKEGLDNQFPWQRFKDVSGPSRHNVRIPSCRHLQLIPAQPSSRPLSTYSARSGSPSGLGNSVLGALGKDSALTAGCVGIFCREAPMLPTKS